jgi:hypothetical protein
MSTAVAEIDPAELADVWLAIHEAAHTVAALRFGYSVGAVTIADSDGGGCCFHQRPEGADVELPTVLEMAGLVLWPWPARQLFERDYMLAAVGRVAEQMYAPSSRSAGYRPPPADEAERAGTLDELERGGFRWLVDPSVPHAPLELKSDEQKWTRAARVGAPRTRRVAYEFLLLRDLEAWVASEPFHRPLAALTRELLRYRTISGAHARRVVAEVDEEMLREVEELGKND